MANGTILLCDDDELIAMSLEKRLKLSGYEVVVTHTGQDAIDSHSIIAPDLMVLDIGLPDMTGFDVLSAVREKDKNLPIMMLSGEDEVDKVVEAMRLGANDYTSKPFDREALMIRLERLIETGRLQVEAEAIHSERTEKFGIETLVGKSESMQRVRELISRGASSASTPVLIEGASGTGKNMVAQILHYASSRSTAPFKTVLCASKNIEDELFGVNEGASKEITATERGILELADGGSVLLDDIAAMSPEIQMKLLRFLEDGVFQRRGSTRDISVDVRLILTSSKDMSVVVHDGVFREDLYYRLSVLPICIPSLAQRDSDIIVLASHFVDVFANELHRDGATLSPDANDALRKYSWPGNLRELRNAIERAMLLSTGDIIHAEDLQLGANRVQSSTTELQMSAVAQRLILTEAGVNFKALERDLIEQSLALSKGNKARAAKLLSMDRDWVRYRARKYEL